MRRVHLIIIHKIPNHSEQMVGSALCSAQSLSSSSASHHTSSGKLHSSPCRSSQCIPLVMKAESTSHSQAPWMSCSRESPTAMISFFSKCDKKSFFAML